jgi:colanic acid biosynthesis glycosyl transferase WcaI
MNDITLVSQYFYPEMISTGHILTELFVALDKQTKKTVFCAQPTYYSTEKVNKIIIHEKIRIIRTSNTQYDKNSMKGKLLNSVTFLSHAFLLLLKQKSNNTVLFVTNPSILGFIGPILKAIKKRKYILLIHDFYPDIAINMGYIGNKSIVAGLWNLINVFVYRHASSIIVLGRDVQKVLMDKIPFDQHKKIVFIPNWADPSLINPIEHKENHLIQQLKLENKFIVEYSGNMGLTHDMETLIEAAKEIQNDAFVHFLMIGGGGKLKKIKEMVKKYNLNNVTFLPYQDRENLKFSLSAAYVSLISLEDGAQGLSVPSKLYGILASGRPSIALMADDSEVAITLKEFRCGITIPPKDVNALVGAIKWFITNESERIDMGLRAREAFLNNYTVEICAEQYLQLIDKVNNRKM